MAPEDAWVKSSHSEGTGNSCVEIARLPLEVGVRDSKNKSGAALVLSVPAWSAFIDEVRTRHLDNITD
ncbi:DUF397 domain-containing protein [Streptomyces roseoverticillatus]|uniref:DUF397 domain-containing protein n=1 Tax=Streptomyces roseoverticillatus TaxID=66429 RepID=UPI001F3AD3E4|nr:DUF397 domain-containing protein [Streptomyces roseoverticillatus]MCF3101003.1 DUF397 domain-containing protein [Streptomyces roseoverticillatus]